MFNNYYSSYIFSQNVILGRKDLLSVDIFVLLSIKDCRRITQNDNLKKDLLLINQIC